MDPQETQLELRLRHLEAITAPRLQRDIWASAFSGQGDGSVLSSLQEVQARLTQITQERRAVADFLEFLKLISTASLAFKDASLKDIIENKTNEIDFSALDGAAKKEIVLASEEELLIFAEQLHEIETLKDEVDVPVLREGLVDVIPQISPAEAQLIAQHNRISQIRERFKYILDVYNQYVDTVSELFCWYHNVLSTLELEVDKVSQQLRPHDA